jgi:hypothetical protein
MTRVRFSEAFSEEHVAQMGTAVGALDFCTYTVRIGQALYGSGYLLIEGRPTTMGLKFVSGPVKFGVAPPANIDPWLKKVVVLSSEGWFRSLEFDHISLLRRKRIVA